MRETPMWSVALRSWRVHLCVALSLWIMALTFALSSGANARFARDALPLVNPEVRAQVPTASALRWISLGYHEAYADLLWVDALSFFGAHYGVRKDPTWILPHLDAITTLDPNFALVYEWAGTAIMYDTYMTHEQVMMSNRILEAGIERFPNEWILHFMLAINYLFELRPSTPEERRVWRNVGTMHLVRAASLPGSPPHLGGAAASQMRRHAELADLAERSRVSFLWSQDAMSRRSVIQSMDRRLPQLEWMALSLERSRVDALRSDARWQIPPALALALHPDPIFAGAAAAPSSPE